MSLRFYTSRRARGFSLLELMVVVTLMAVALLAIAESLVSSQNAIELTSVQSSLEAKAHDVLERVARDAKDGILNSFPPQPATLLSSISFKKATGWDPALPAPASANLVDQRLKPTGTLRYVLITDPAQMINGVMTTVTHLDYIDPAGSIQVLSDRLKPATATYPGGFYYSLNGNQLSITVELEQKYHRSSTTAGADAQGYLTYTASATTAVTIHN